MDIHSRVRDLIGALINFKLSYDVSKYLADQAITDWSSFEATQHEQDYPIKGCGLIADTSMLADWSWQRNRDETLLHLEEDLAPEHTGSEIDSFPRDTVSTVYIYSLLEGFGNDFCDFLNPSYRRIRQAWHHEVHADADCSNTAVRAAMKASFCKPFGFDPAKIPDEIITGLVELKRERNEIAHELHLCHDFETYLRIVAAVSCCIYFNTPGSHKSLDVYPWDDYHDKYGS